MNSASERLQEWKPRPIILFGSEGWAEFLCQMLADDGRFEVVAFTVDRAFIKSNTVLGLPVIPFDEITDHMPPSDYAMMVGAGFGQKNRFRAQKCSEAKSMGYDLISFVSADAMLAKNVRIGENSTIHEGAIVQQFCTLGDNVQILSGANVSHHCTIGDHAFIAGSVTLGGGCHIGDYCFIGMNATILHGLTIAPNVVIGAGSVVTRDIETAGTYVGNPARLLADHSEL